jgi:pimeloyl-ACP methyl ester carboxylesterase
VAAVVEHLGYSSVSFFGWSNGMVVGFRSAQEYPEMFDSLILMGGMSRAMSREEVVRAVDKRVPVMRERGWWSILDRMQAAEKIPVPRWFVQSVLATDTGPWIAFTESMKDWDWSPWEAMPKIQAPTLLLAGELEDPQDVLAEAAAAMPHATRVRIPEREHINAFLYSDFVAPRVLEFLAARKPQTTG